MTLLKNCLTKSSIDLYEDIIKNNECKIGNNGQICVETGKYTGRAADAKYIVNNPLLASSVEFGAAGKEISVDAFNVVLNRVQAYLQNRNQYETDFIAGNIKGRVITEFAWQALFVKNLLQNVNQSHDNVELTIVSVPGCSGNINGDPIIACDLARGLFLICGTAYAGEIKKSVFTYASYKLALANELPMHASVTTSDDDVAVFFGLSGTGKTTLSADPTRQLLGDDEHSWTDSGIYNIESGCYAKVINLSESGEPDIYSAANKFMTILENVELDSFDQRLPNFASSKLTENTRAAYPLNYINNSHPSGTIVKHPKNIIMLTCDAYGVMPSVAKLSNDAAIYHFLAGYTAKIAGTEAGIKEPKATFSRCFGAPFMPHKASIYADLLKNKLELHKPNIWLVNTGWVTGPYGVGHRINLQLTRDIIKTILNGDMSKRDFVHEPVLNLMLPVGIEHADPTWDNKEEYEIARAKLVKLFQENFNSTMNDVEASIKEAGPKVK